MKDTNEAPVQSVVLSSLGPIWDLELGLGHCSTVSCWGANSKVLFCLHGVVGIGSNDSSLCFVYPRCFYWWPRRNDLRRLRFSKPNDAMGEF
jgi:hypothetical protein